ncbi:MAG TPA: hypothetical protein VFJ05_01320 [Nitrososphaeraceae archaeon]|nr:hypothetical protein [Nitrososphaeraceae archaeon]
MAILILYETFDIKCAANEEKRIVEDSKKVAQNYNINVEEDIPDSPIYRRLQEKIQMVEDERDYYRDQYCEITYLPVNSNIQL